MRNLAVLLLIAMLSGTALADSKISGMTSGGALQTQDEIPIARPSSPGQNLQASFGAGTFDNLMGVSGAVTGAMVRASSGAYSLAASTCALFSDPTTCAKQLGYADPRQFGAYCGSNFNVNNTTQDDAPGIMAAMATGVPVMIPYPGCKIASYVRATANGQILFSFGEGNNYNSNYPSSPYLYVTNDVATNSYSNNCAFDYAGWDGVTLRNIQFRANFNQEGTVAMCNSIGIQSGLSAAFLNVEHVAVLNMGAAIGSAMTSYSQSPSNTCIPTGTLGNNVLQVRIDGLTAIGTCNALYGNFTDGHWRDIFVANASGVCYGVPSSSAAAMDVDGFRCEYNQNSPNSTTYVFDGTGIYLGTVFGAQHWANVSCDHISGSCATLPSGTKHLELSNWSSIDSGGNYKGVGTITNQCAYTMLGATDVSATGMSAFKNAVSVPYTLCMSGTNDYITWGGTTNAAGGSAGYSTAYLNLATTPAHFDLRVPGLQNLSVGTPQVISLNTTSLPAAQTGAVLQLGNADGTPTRIEADSFGATDYFTSLRKDGTNASPTALLSGDEIGGFNAWGYNGTGIVGPQASFRTYANQNWAVGANGAYADVATTTNGTTTLSEVIKFENDGGITIPGTVTGGDKGPGTINATGYFVNGVSIPPVGVAPPSNPTVGSTWLSTNLANLRTDPSPLLHIPVVRPSVNAQEPNVWYASNQYNMLFTSSGLEYTYCPGADDPLAAFNAVASISGNTLTVTAMNQGVIQPGMIIDAGNNGTFIEPYGTSATTGIGGIGTYKLSSSLGTSASQNRSGSFWATPVTVIGNGQGGVTDPTAHSSVYIEGSTIYAYFVDLTTNAVGVATAALTSPTSWTYQNQIVSGTGVGNGTTNGNPRVVKNGSTYYLFQEGLNYDTFPGEGSTDSWQEFLCTSSSALGPFTGCTELTTLRTGPNASNSDMSIIQQNGVWVAYYHSQNWGRVLPSDIYVATTSSIATDTWVVQNNGSPLLKRSNNYEVDQAADPKLVQSPGGAWYMFYTAADNTSGGLGFHIMATKLMPSLMQWNGVSWVSGESYYSNSPPARNSGDVFFKQNIPWLSPSGTQSAGTWGLEQANVPGGYLRYNSSNAQNDSIQWDTYLPPGAYSLDLYYQTGAAGGIYTVSISDGTNGNFPVNVGTIDSYAATTGVGHTTLTFTFYGTETIRRRLRFLASTHNASSSGYTLADYGWTITKTDQ